MTDLNDWARNAERFAARSIRQHVAFALVTAVAWLIGWFLAGARR